MLRPHLIQALSLLLYHSRLIHVLRFLGRHYVKILLYHSVSDGETAFVKGTNISVSPARFVEQLNYLLSHYHVIPLETLVSDLKEKRVRPYSVLITFDDGFADNYHVVYPYLKSYNVPATVFLATDCMDNKKPIWIQELYYLINTVGVEEVATRIGPFAESERTVDLPKENNSSRNLARAVEEYLAYSITKKTRRETLHKLYKELGIPWEQVFWRSRIYLSWDQVREMRANGLSFGNHGESHTPFSAMPLDEQEAEISRSRKIIEENLGTGFLPFGYPYGQERDFSADTKQILEKAGYRCILTAMPTLNHAETSPSELGRIHIENAPVWRFAFELEKAALKHLLGKYLGFKRS